MDSSPKVIENNLYKFALKCCKDPSKVLKLSTTQAGKTYRVTMDIVTAEGNKSYHTGGFILNTQADIPHMFASMSSYIANIILVHNL